jgi:hypothetical protein
MYFPARGFPRTAARRRIGHHIENERCRRGLEPRGEFQPLRRFPHIDGEGRHQRLEDVAGRTAARYCMAGHRASDPGDVEPLDPGAGQDIGEEIGE